MGIANTVWSRAQAWLVACLLGMAAAPFAHAELGDNLLVDPVAMSLGNAVTADPPGIASIHFNPAGLARIEADTRSDSVSVVSIRNPNTFQDASNIDIGGFKDDPLNNTHSGSVRQRLYLPIIGLLPWHMPALVLPSLGLAFHQPNSPFTFGTMSYPTMGLSFDRSDPNDPAAYDGKLVDIERIVYFSPTVGYKVSDTLRVGVGVPIAYGALVVNTDMRMPNTLLGIIGKVQQGFCPNGEQNVVDVFFFGLCGGGKNGMLNPFNKVANMNLELTAPIDPTINLGVLWEPVDWFALGAVLQGGTSTYYHGTYVIDAAPELRAFTYGLQHSLLGPLTAAITAMPASIPAVQSGHVVADIPFPTRVQLGVKLKPVSFLQFNMDVSYADWAKWNSLTMQFDQNINLLEMARIFGISNSSQLTLPVGARSVVNYSFGLQMQVTSDLALRAGYEPRKSSIPGNQINLIAPLPNTKLMSLGLEYKLGNGASISVAGTLMKGSYNVPARTDCNLNCDNFFNVVYNPYAAMNVEGTIIIRFFGVKFTKPF
ncbi:MAG: OmpP1/FadL family transporter [Burkholderiales bacterium]